MAVRPEPVRDAPRDDREALEEIRLLFARYRQVARHGQAAERDRPSQAPTHEVKRTAVASGR